MRLAPNDDALMAVHRISASHSPDTIGLIANLTKLQSHLRYSRNLSRYAKCSPMGDHESIIIHATQIDGQTYPEDYTVIWRGLPIGRIRKNPGLPDYVDQWSWGCNVYGQQSVRGDSGQGTDLEDCKVTFKAAWARVRARLSGADVAKAREEHRQSRPKNQERNSALGSVERQVETGGPPAGNV